MGAPVPCAIPTWVEMVLGVAGLISKETWPSMHLADDVWVELSLWQRQAPVDMAPLVRPVTEQVDRPGWYPSSMR